MAISSNRAPHPGKGLAGDTRELARRLGSPENLAELASALAASRPVAVVDSATFRRFLSDYVTTALIPVELPLVSRSFALASRGQVAELIALDRAQVPAGTAAGMAEASQRVGRKHLRAMRPLRGERRVQRYVQAVQQGRAFGWHSTVYGLALAVYSIPLRPGLQSFYGQTVRGFIDAARSSLNFEEGEVEALEREFGELLRPAIDGLLGESHGALLQLV